jgi:hypothetical protein
MAKITLDFILANNRKAAATGEEGNSLTNSYISEFCQNEWIFSLRQLADENQAVRKLLNHKSLKKEITELYGALHLFEKFLQKSHSLLLSQNDNKMKNTPAVFSDNPCDPFPLLHHLDETHHLAFYDICSGKGIASFFLSFLFPHSKIILIDSDPTMKLDHLLISQCSHVKYFNYNIYSNEFLHFLEIESQINSSLHISHPLLFGLHLCGTLSLRLCSLFNSLPLYPLLVLSPCCMPKNKKSNSSHRLHLGKWGRGHGHGGENKKKGTGVREQQSDEQNEEFTGYDYWCLNVYHQLDPTQMRRDMKQDACVISERSKYIVGSRTITQG